MYSEETVTQLSGKGEPAHDESMKTEKTYFEECEDVRLTYHEIEVLETAVGGFGKDRVNEKGERSTRKNT